MHISSCKSRHRPTAEGAGAIDYTEEGPTAKVAEEGRLQAARHDEGDGPEAEARPGIPEGDGAQGTREDRRDDEA